MAAEETPKEEKGLGKGKSTYTSGQKPPPTLGSIDKPEEEEKEEEKETKRKKRTKKQVDKLTKSNKELKKERDQYKSVIDSLRPEAAAPPPPPPPELTAQPRKEPEKTDRVPSAEQYKGLTQDQVDDVFSGMMDKEGYVDGNKLMTLLRNMNDRATRAEQRAQIAEQKAELSVKEQRDFEESQEVRRVHNKYPQIDPKNDDFNEELFDSVRNEMIGQMMQGKSDFMAATEKWYNRLYKEEEVATRKEKEEQLEKEDAKAQISATSPRSSSMSGYYKDYELKKLQEDTMAGKKGALAERLRRSGHGPA